MSIMDDVKNAQKIQFRLQVAILTQLAGAKPEETSLALVFRAAHEFKGPEGMHFDSTLGDIRTTRTSLNGLKALLDDPKVTSIEGQVYRPHP